MAQPPSPEELGPLLGATNGLDDPAPPEDSESSEFEAAAMTAVGTRAKAQALRDAFDAWAREKGLLGEESASDEDAEGSDSGPDDTESSSSYGG